MTDPEQLAHTETIPGYDLGTKLIARSPLTLDDLKRLEQAVGLTDVDDRLLARAGELLAPYAAEMVDAWRAMLAPHPHLGAYSQHHAAWTKAVTLNVTLWTRPYVTDENC